MALLERLRGEGKVRLIGATHYSASAFGKLEQVMRSGRIDAIQIPYNPFEREVEARLLPLAAELGRWASWSCGRSARARVLRRPPPPDRLAPLEPFGVRTWTQALLKWILERPALPRGHPGDVEPDACGRERCRRRAAVARAKERALMASLAG